MENNPTPPIPIMPVLPENQNLEIKEFATGHAHTNVSTTGASGYNAVDITIFVLGSLGLAWLVGLMGFAVVPMYLFQGIGVLVTGILGLIAMFMLANVGSYTTYTISYAAFAMGNAVGGLIAFAVVATSIRMGMAHRHMQHHHHTGMTHHHHKHHHSSGKGKGKHHHHQSRSRSRY